MKWIINYIRSCFCEHEWEHITTNKIWTSKSDEMPSEYHIIYRCKKCGYVQKIKC